MPVKFSVLPDHNLVLVTFSGMVTLAETTEAFDRYSSHPDARPGQSHLVDLSAVTEYERDFTKIMALQAHQVDVFLKADAPIYLIFVAPTELTRTMAMAAVRSWQNLPGVIPLVLTSLDEARAVLSLEKRDLEPYSEPVAQR